MKRKNFLLTPLLAVPTAAFATFKNFAPATNLFKIELDFTPQLEQKEISKFVLNASPTNYKSADPTETNFSLVATKPSGTQPMSLFANVKYYYNVFYKNALVSNFSVIVPVEQKIVLTIKSNLLIQDGLEQSIVDKIKTAFKNYDPNVGVDPTDYANLIDKFKIICSFELDKDGVFIEHREQLNAILALYSDVHATGTITSLTGSSKITGNNTLFLTEMYPGSIIRSSTGQQIGTVDKITSNTELAIKQPASISNNNASFLIDVLSKIYVLNETTISDYFKKRKYKIVLVKRELLDELEKPDVDTVHEVESNDPSIIDAIVTKDTEGLDCGNQTVDKPRIATIFVYPEFKTVVEWRMVKIGCIKTLIPFIHHTQIRYTEKTLYACVGRPKNLDQLVVEQIKNCAISSALSAAVIGIAFDAIAIALVAFKALFVQCVKSSIEGDISCFIPDLVILSETGPWHDV